MKSYLSLKRIKNKVYWHVKIRGCSEGNPYRKQYEQDLFGDKAIDYIVNDLKLNGENSLLAEYFKKQRTKRNAHRINSDMPDNISFTLTYESE